MIKILIASLAFWFLPSSATPQAPQKIKIFFSCDCDDAIGAQYATAVRDVIAVSPRYELTMLPSEGTGTKKSYYWALKVVSLDVNQAAPGSKTAIAVTLNMNDTTQVSQSIQICGVERVKQCAVSTLANADDVIQKFIEAFVQAFQPKSS